MYFQIGMILSLYYETGYLIHCTCNIRSNHHSCLQDGFVLMWLPAYPVDPGSWVSQPDKRNTKSALPFFLSLSSPSSRPLSPPRQVHRFSPSSCHSSRSSSPRQGTYISSSSTASRHSCARGGSSSRVAAMLRRMTRGIGWLAAWR